MDITTPEETPEDAINDQQAYYEEIQNRRKLSWLKVFTGGLVLYIFGVLALASTRNTNIFPTVVMLGNFLVPITYVAFFYQRRHLSKLDMPTTAWAFFYGGLLGVLAAATLEPIFLSQHALFYSFEVGLIEEFAKILGVLVIAKRCYHDSEMDGLILGAASGMGFAALESSGYAFTAFLNSGGSLSQTVLITLVRGVIAPIGHGTWTAILVSTMFRESEPRKFHINFKVIGAYITVAALHGLWNGLPEVLSVFPIALINVFTGQVAVAIIGFYLLWKRYEEAKKLQIQRLWQGIKQPRCWN
ncbi:PrsW family intramembrane metalloprotease [Methanolobus bombayensis]|uniref:PrsW family intramembrane metalloprotease n=1 Tax=Methanolobus bombayensis TaxID=38023 RepID=UPI001AE48B6D|nr:PrsW family intramembrane metalloprotease [Methanolobus bombayensis]MBP1908029.1 RsiW-degrading membrane proteinase PrsW (M82 family) [Methanolobus bombayensis]